MKANE